MFDGLICFCFNRVSFESILFPAQFLVLGAGFDTAWFQLASEGQAPRKYLELDFLEVCVACTCVYAWSSVLMYACVCACECASAHQCALVLPA